MEKLLITIIPYSLILIFDLRPILKAKKYKTFWIYSVLLLLSFVLIVASSLQLPLVSPNELITQAVLFLTGGA